MGIGTTDPGAYALAVEGTVGAREVVVTMDSWSDFVFDDNYRLMPIGELRKFIKERHSLPGIPTENEVREKGVSLGEMQKRLLEKIEELSLYVVDQHAQIEKQQKLIEALFGQNRSLQQKMNRIGEKIRAEG